MTDFVKILSNVHRPRLLIRAARFGVQDYDRARRRFSLPTMR